MRLQDRVDAPTGKEQLSFDRLIGSWHITDPEPQVLQGVSIVPSGGTLFIELFETGLIVPPSNPAMPVITTFAAGPASRQQMSFFAEADFGAMASRFQGNVNLGLLVLAGFHDFKDGSTRTNFFSREFYYFAGAQPAKPLASISGASPKNGSRHLDSSALAGLWENTNSASTGVPKLEIWDSGEQLTVRAFGADESGLVDWGEVSGRAYGKDFQSYEAMAFSATFTAALSGHPAGMCCHLQANIKQGVLVVAYFTEFNDDSGRSNYFAREFYYKTKEG